MRIGIGSRLRRSAAGGVTRAAAYRVSVYGDSFGQRIQTILGQPNITDLGVVDPQLLKWASTLTTPVGNVQWGFGTWLSLLSGGKFDMNYQLNHGIGGFNTGQLVRFGGADPTPWYLSDYINRMLALPVGERPQAVIYQAGTNDDAASFSAVTSYGNIRTTCQKIVEGLGIPVFLCTVLPRGNAANVGSRITAGANVARVVELNDRLTGNGYAGLAAESVLLGLVRVIDPRTSFNDGGGLANDILDALVYDGLHLSASGCRLLAQSYLTAMNAYLTASMLGHLPTGATYIPNGLMTGTAGTINRTGNAASNTAFTLNGGAQTVNSIAGIMPDGWIVGTSLGGGASAWNGTSPNNITGDLTATVVAADVGSAIQVVLTCNGSGLTTANTRAVEAAAVVTLPGTGVLAAGEAFRGIAVVELSGHAGLRGVSAELRTTDPDMVTAAAQGPFTLATVGLPGDTFTIGTGVLQMVYTLVVTVSGTPNANQVKIGATAADTAINLDKAIGKKTITAAVEYGADTVVNPLVSSTVASNVVTLTARQRIAHSSIAAPNGTANMTLDPAVNFTGAGRFVIMTPPVIRKTGTYGAIDFALFLYVAGQANPINATWKISQAGVVKVT